ncbi:MAG: GGDEF domain-containing protein [Bdellovibrionota bacterium]
MALLLGHRWIRHPEKMASESLRRRSLEKLMPFDGFKSVLRSEFDRIQRYQRPLSILVIDIDDYKKLSEHHGKEHSDRLIREVAWIVFESTRGTDIIALSKTKFIILLPETIHDKAMLLAWRIRKLVETFPFDLEHLYKMEITISIGVASPNENTHQAYQLYALANRALQHAKRQKNTVFSFNQKEPETYDPIELSDARPRLKIVPGDKSDKRNR